MLTRLFKPVQLLYALLRLLFAFEVEFQPQGIIQIETSLDCLGLPCVCVRIKTRACHVRALIEKQHDMNPWRLQVPILGGQCPSSATWQNKDRLKLTPMNCQQLAAVLRIFLHVLGFLPVPQLRLMKGYIRDVLK